MSEELFDLLMAHINALVDLRINKELGRSNEGGYRYLLQSTERDVRELIRRNDG